MTKTLVGVTFSLFLASGAAAEIRHMVCVLTGSQEVPAVATTARGCGVFEVNTDTNEMRYRIVVYGISTGEVAAHIHGFAAPGVNAAVKHPLPLGVVKTGVWTFAEADQASILAGLTYVNSHSNAFPGGEIRGQIVDMVATIDSAQEVPANAGTGQGVGLFMLDTAANTLTYRIIAGGLSSAEIAAHIHGTANYGTNAGVLHPLPLGALKTGTWTYPEASEQALKDGLMYVNIHTSSFPGGEIRGQVVRSVNPMDRTQEVPASNTNSVGCGFCGMDRGANVLGYDVQTNLVASTEIAAHIHGFAPEGTNAGVKQPLALGARKLGTWSFGGDAEEALILSEQTYFNVHTNVFAGGEIRGQIRWPDEPPAPCAADFNGDGFLDFFDYDDYVTCFETGACPPGRDADFNRDAFVDFFDYDDFVTAFEGGC